jgi:hypothetical protein
MIKAVDCVQTQPRPKLEAARKIDTTGTGRLVLVVVTTVLMCW